MNDKEQNTQTAISEKEFLSSYSIEAFERPSVAADIAVFSMFTEDATSHRKDSEPKLHILLIQRGEHPFLNSWALPGGFLKSDETIEECALRELAEEAKLIPASMMPIGVFSEPKRDPRGRIVSNAFLSVVSEENVAVSGGGDAVNAKWFELCFSEGENQLKLSLKNGEEVMNVELAKVRSKLGRVAYEIISSNGLAFDHAKIIATALNALRNEAERFIITFDFLPEKFTLASLQRVQEILVGNSLLTANFRRKTASLVIETDEYTEGVGHRPARLFIRNAEQFKI